MRVDRKAQAAQFAADVLPIIRDIQAAGHTSLNAIAGQLNARKVATPTVANGGMCRCGTCVSHQMDAFVHRYIHENLCYRFVMLPDGAAASAAEATIKSGGWEYGRPLLNPRR